MPVVTRTRSWPRFLLHFSIASTALVLGLMSWFIASPPATRIYQTAPGERLNVTPTPAINISLDTNSMATVTNALPPRIELLRGNAYFDVQGNESGTLQVKVGAAYIRDMDTRFSVSVRANGGTVAVAYGQVEIEIGTRKYLVGALERADFNNINVTGQRVIAEADVAPWRLGRR